MSGKLRQHIRQNVVGYIALFLVISGGTAYATHPGGQNTISSGDIIDDQIRSVDIRTNNIREDDIGGNAVISRHIKGGAVQSSDVRDDTVNNGGLNAQDLNPGSVGTSEVEDDSLTAGDLADVGFLQADTATLNDQPGGSSAAQLLFAIGGVRLNAFCQDQGNGTLVGGLSPVVDEAGPVLVLDGDGSAVDDDIELQPFDVQFAVIANSSANVVAREASFAILDTGGDSASGVAAVSVDPSTGDCVITAHAIG